MLRRFSVSNYLSFREEAVLDLTLSKRDEGQGFYHKVNGRGAPVSTASGIFGANGSGKTVLLKALDFVMSFATDFTWLQKQESVVILPIMSWFNNEEPCRFVLEWQSREGYIYDYTLVLNRSHVVSEHLTVMAHEKGRRKDVLLSRIGTEVREAGGVLAGLNYDNLQNTASFLPMARAQGAKLDPVLGPIHIIRHFSPDYNDRIPLFIREGANGMLLSLILNSPEKDQFLAQTCDFLCGSDLGLAGIEVEKKENSLDGKGLPEFDIYGVHELADGRRIRLSFKSESEGTRVLLSYFTLIYLALKEGTPLLLDEFDAALHVSMLEAILDLFDDPDTNPYGAQIIFTTHSETLMNKLGKAHIYLVEKRECESEAFRLDSVKGVRASDNFSRKYLGGFYGGVPQL